MLRINKDEFNLEDLLLHDGRLIGLKDEARSVFRKRWHSYLLT